MSFIKKYYVPTYFLKQIKQGFPLSMYVPKPRHTPFFFHLYYISFSGLGHHPSSITFSEPLR